MRLTHLPLTTLKETPADAEIISHQLMLRAGLIRRLSSGPFTWMPLGLRVLRKVERIVREEMNRAGEQRRFKAPPDRTPRAGCAPKPPLPGNRTRQPSATRP